MSIQNQLQALKDIFLESNIKYKGVTLTSEYVSIGQIPAVDTIPHINIIFKKVLVEKEFTGQGNKITTNFDINFIIRPRKFYENEDKNKIQELTDDLNKFARDYIVYLLDNYRYGYNNLWYYAEQSSFNEEIKFENNNLFLTFNLNLINY
jgi:hypothetical protein